MKKRSPPQQRVTKQPNTQQPWSCEHQTGKSRIKAFSTTTKKYETIAHLLPWPDGTPENTAEFIVKAINTLNQRETLIDEMQIALEACIDHGKLDWATEHDADVAIRHAKNRLRV